MGQLLSIVVVYSHDGWLTELCLPATTQHHDSIVPHITSLGKDQNSKSEGLFLLNECFLFSQHQKVKEKS